MKASLCMLGIMLSLLLLVILLVGCGGGGDTTLFLNVRHRCGWAPVADGRLSLASYGGNGLLYIYSLMDAGRGLTLLTPSNNDPNNLAEGGWHPSYSPDGQTIAFVSKRGPSASIYTMDATVGDRGGVTGITDDSTYGADAQPNWSPDSTKIIYSSTRSNNFPNIHEANADGSGGITNLTPDANSYEWPCYKPTDATEIVMQSDRDEANPDDTDLFIFVNLIGGGFTKIADSDFEDGAPSWSPDGTKIAFHSDRAGDFDIWVYDVAGATVTQLTNDARSDGFPVWNYDGSRLAFTRDRELWTMAADGSDQKQLTRRF